MQGITVSIKRALLAILRLDPGMIGTSTTNGKEDKEIYP
jgi:hypothetical protein